jgi:hypothetical protein
MFARQFKKSGLSLSSKGKSNFVKSFGNKNALVKKFKKSTLGYPMDIFLNPMDPYPEFATKNANP